MNMVVKSLHGMFKIENEVMTNPKYSKYSIVFISYFNHIKKYQLGSELIPNINSYLEKNKEASNYNVLSKDLCNTFYSLVNQPFLVDLGKLIRLISQTMMVFSLQDFENFIKAMVAINSSASSLSMKSTSSRALSDSSASTDPFTADTTTCLLSSSSYQSTSQNNALQPVIDLSKSFP